MGDKGQTFSEDDHLAWLADLAAEDAARDEDPLAGACEAAVPTADKSWLECGQDAVAVYDYRCHEGHVKRRATCTEHEPVPGAVGCRECWETAGVDRPMTFTKIAGPGRTITEAEYRAWLEWKQPQLAAELTECLPQEVRDAGMRVEWSADGQPVASDGLPVAIPVRNTLGTRQPATDSILGALDRMERLGYHARRTVYEAVMPPYRPDDPLWAWFDDHSPGAKCYRLGSGSMVHVKPGCRCPR